MNVLLQLLDDGRLTDGQGRTVDFSNCLIILTSNIGQEHLIAAASTSATSNSAKPLVMQELRMHFKPEFLNRLDDIVMFNPLTRPVLGRIITNQITLINKRLEGRGVKIVLEESAVDRILDSSWDTAAYGARPLKRLLEREIVTGVAKMLLEGKIAPGTTVAVAAEEPGMMDEDAGEFTFKTLMSQ
jgi:ATP-dependent Clp protease ATP-binding subunit ClpB